MRVFIVGHISGLPQIWTTATFRKDQQRLEAYGHAVTNPTHVFTHTPDAEWEDYMATWVHQLMQSEAVYLQPEWEQDSNARMLCRLAKLTSKRIIDGPNQLPPIAEQLGIFNDE